MFRFGAGAIHEDVRILSVQVVALEKPTEAKTEQWSTSRLWQRSGFRTYRARASRSPQTAGVDYVIVNGRIVLQKGERSAARPGRSLRRIND